MSEAERKRRLDYKKNRKKWLMIQAIIIAVVALIVLGSTLTYYQLNKTFYINYTERSDIDYKVALKPNEFYEETVLDKGQIYVASLIDSVTADIMYELNMETEDVDYEYSYNVEAQLLVADKSGVAIFDPVYEIKPLTKHEQSTNKLTIKENVTLDYEEYNSIANAFVTEFGLKDVVCTLIVRMNIEVNGACDEFSSDSSNSYSTALNIPLTEKTVNIEMTQSVPSGESKVLACSTALNKDIFKITGIVFTIIDILLLITYVSFAYLTRNEDINYSIKIKKLLSNYRSYIQRLTNEFDTEGYQILTVGSFNEMLSIRDTIQSPILMNENEDQTRSRFMIPTNTKILYMFEIKVDNYDLIYGEAGETAPVEEVIIIPEEPVVHEPDHAVMEEYHIAEEALEEALESPDVELEEIDFVDTVDEEYVETEEAPGVDVIGVVWPERAHKNKVYRYDPNGEQVDDGDIVLVPTRDAARDRNIIRKAAVAHGNHKVDPESLTHPLKKIIGIVRRKAEMALTPHVENNITEEKTNEAELASVGTANVNESENKD